MGRGRRALPARRRPRRRARPARRSQPRAPRADRRTSCGVPVQYGGGLRSLPAVRDALRAGAERVILGTAAFTDIDFLDDVARARYGDRVHRRRSTRAAATSRRRAGQETTQMPAEARHRAPAGPRRALVRLHRTSTATACSSGPDLDEVRRIAEVVRGRFLVLRRHRHARRPRARWPRCARSTSRGVIVGKALYEGRFTVAEGQAAALSPR